MAHPTLIQQVEIELAKLSPACYPLVLELAQDLQAEAARMQQDKTKPRSITERLRARQELEARNVARIAAFLAQQRKAQAQ